MMRILTHVVFRIVMSYIHNVHNIRHQRVMAMILVILSFSCGIAADVCGFLFFCCN